MCEIVTSVIGSGKVVAWSSCSVGYVGVKWGCVGGGTMNWTGYSTSGAMNEDTCWGQVVVVG